MKRILLISAMLMSCMLGLHAQLKLASLVGNNMVLQQQTDARLWGWAKAGDKITATTSWNGETVQTTANKEGLWILSVSTPQASFTPYEITITDGKTPVTLTNILIGEVWLAGGQSNMEMPLKGFGGCCIKDGLQEAIEAANYPYVRMHTIPKAKSWEVVADAGSQWQLPTLSAAMEMSATAWFFAKNLSQALHVPVGIVNCSYGGTRVESWLPRHILETYPDIDLTPEGLGKYPDWETPLMMYNAMFPTVTRYTYKGIIWYQGCSNVGSHTPYAQRLATMVAHWREQLALGDIPFYYVEIAPYDYDSAVQDEQSAYLREAQYKAQSLIPNSQMIGTNDLVEPYERFNIHPRRKAEVGQRLSYVALNKTYGMKQIYCENPTYNGDFSVKGNEVFLGFNNLDMGICRNYQLEGFEVAGEDRIFHPADSVWIEWQTNHAVVSSKQVPKPVAVRYCFRDFQIGNFIGGNELPLIPFRTDNW